MRKLSLPVVVAVAVAWVAEARAQNDPEQDPARHRAVAWIKAHNRWGHDAPIVKDMTELIDQAVRAGENYRLSFGEGLLNTGTPFAIASWDGQFFVFALTAEQARRWGLNPMSVNTRTGKRRATRDMPIARIHSVSIDNATALDGSAKITGEATLEIMQPLPRNTALRLSFATDSGTHAMMFYPENLPNRGTTTMRFSFSSVNSPSDEKQHSGPLPAFVDLCTITQSGADVDTKILSDTVSTLMDVSGAGAIPSLAGKRPLTEPR